VRRPLTALLVALAALASGCGSEPDASPRTAPPSAGATPRGGLAMGLTEANPDLLWHGADVGAFAPWRDRLEALRPPLYRLVVDWAQVQPSPDAPPDWTRVSDGCMRGRPPCRSWAGVRDVLRALRSQQLADHGFAAMVVFQGAPDWAARPPGGCERPGIAPRSRPLTDAGLRAYRALVRSLQDLAVRERVAIRWWSPWNEPNGSFFISPQRADCRPGSPPLSPGVYARLARALRGELREGQELVVGELAGFQEARRYGTSIAQFFAALPDDVVCGAGVFAQHAYAQRGDRADDPGAVAELERVLARRPCAARQPIWVTETGVGGPHVGDERASSEASLRADCRALDTTLRRWREDPRVDAAFQYTFRDDPVFPVGLADAGLTRTWPAYDLWRGWAGARRPDGPAPPLPAACAAS
jgi:hypothetical protein